MDEDDELSEAKNFFPPFRNEKPAYLQEQSSLEQKKESIKEA